MWLALAIVAVLATLGILYLDRDWLLKDLKRDLSEAVSIIENTATKVSASSKTELVEALSKVKHYL